MENRNFYELNNRLLDERSKSKFLIVAHRGQWGANIIQNSVNASKLTKLFGAEIMELDLAETKDKKYIVFHTGYETSLCNQEFVVGEKSSEELTAIRVNNGLHEPINEYLQLVDDLLLQAPKDIFFQIDRAYFYFPEVLNYLMKFEEDIKCRMMIKCPLKEKYLNELNEFPFKFMVMPILDKASDVSLINHFKYINFIGIEILADDEKSDTFGAEFIKKIHEDYNLLVQINAIKLNDTRNLYAGYDDNVSLLEDPAKGWGVLVDIGADIIQTDWALPLSIYRKSLK